MSVVIELVFYNSKSSQKIKQLSVQLTIEIISIITHAEIQTSVNRNIKINI